MRRRPSPAMWALTIAPLIALSVHVLVERTIGPPGKAIGLSGTPRHVVTGIAEVALLLVTAVFVGRRAYVSGTHPLAACLLGIAAIAMTYFWALVAFVIGWGLSGPHS